MAKRITGEILNNFNIKQYGKYRTREYPRGTAREYAEIMEYEIGVMFIIIPE